MTAPLVLFTLHFAHVGDGTLESSIGVCEIYFDVEPESEILMEYVVIWIMVFVVCVYLRTFREKIPTYLGD